MSEAITKAAIDFITKRREKLDAKYKRNECRCEIEDPGDHITAPVESCRFYDGPEEERCDSCKQFTQKQFAYMIVSRAALAALKRLERRVNAERKVACNPG